MSRTHLVRVAAWSCLCLIIYATLSPLRDRPILLPWSSAEHFAAFAALGGLFYLAYPRHTLAVLIVILGSAVLLELLQLVTFDRHARIADAVHKIAGGASGVLAGCVILYSDRVRFWLQAGSRVVSGQKALPCDAESNSTEVRLGE